MKRTTVVLDSASLDAAHQLSSRLHVSMSEVIRRALLDYRDKMVGITPEFRDQRVAALHRLFDLFEDHDARDEIRRLKSEDRGY
jgi:hypothetical protein